MHVKGGAAVARPYEYQNSNSAEDLDEQAFGYTAQIASICMRMQYIDVGLFT